MEFALEFERNGEYIGVARSRGVELVFDTGRGVDKQGMWPMEVLVSSLAGCLNLDLGSAMEEAGYPVEKLTMQVTGHRDDDIPCIDTASYRIEVWSPRLEQATAEQLLSYALGRSTIYNTLVKAVQLTITVTAHNTDPALL